MALTTKTAVESEYTAKRSAIIDITPAAMNTALAGADGFVIQVREAVLVFRAREALNGRPDADASAIAAKATELAQSVAMIRALAIEIQGLFPV